MKVARLLRVLALLPVLLWAGPGWAGQVYKLHVDGLACPFCAYGIEKKVSALAGVDKVEIDIESGLVAVTMADGATLSEAAARRAVDDAGFKLRKFEAAEAKPDAGR